MSESTKSQSQSNRNTKARHPASSSQSVALAVASAVALMVAGPAMAQSLLYVSGGDAQLGSAGTAAMATGGTLRPSTGLGAFVVPADFYAGSAPSTTGELEADLTWTGTAGDGLFGTAANWSSNTVPVAGDNVIFNNAVTGTVTNNVVGAPTLFGNFVASRTDANTSTFAGGGSFNSIVTQRGNYVFSGGTWTARGLTNPGITATSTGAPANVGVVFGASTAAPTSVTVNNGTVLNYDGGLYVTDRNGSTGSLTISGAGTSVAGNPANFATNQGRFGTAGGTATINVTDGGALSGRYFQPNRVGGGSAVLNVTNGGQVTTQVAQNLNTSATAVINVDGSTSAINVSAALVPITNETYNLTNGGKIIGVGTGEVDIDQGATYNVLSGSSIVADRGFANPDNVAGNSTYNVSGAGSTIRYNYFLDTNRGSENATTPVFPNGRVNINVGPGATFSVGLMNGDGANTDAGATSVSGTNIDVNGGTFEARNSTGFVNSYFELGSGNQTVAGKQSSTLTVRNGGTVAVIDDNGGTGTGGLGQAFNSIGDGARTTVNVNVKSGSTYTVGGTTSLINSLSVASGTSSTVTFNIDSVDGSGNALPTQSVLTAQNLSVATGERAPDSPVTTATFNIGKGGRLNITGADTASTTFVSEDKTSVTTFNVSGGSADLGGAVFLGGGNQDAGVGSFGGGNTTITVTDGGNASLGRAFLVQDPGVLAASEGAVTTISVSGAGSTFTADGTDSTTTTALDSGYLAISTQLTNAAGTVVSPDTSGRFGTLTLSVSNGGLIKTTEASLLGGLHDGTITVNVTGAGSVYDSGRQFSLNSDLRETTSLDLASTGVNSSAVVNISGGGVLKTTGSAAQATGSIFIGTDNTSSGSNGVGTTSTTVTITGAGSKLESSSSILLGASIVSSAFTDGTPVTLTAGAGTTISASSTGSFLLGSTSTATTAGTVSVGNIGSAGIWTVNGGSFTSSSLELIGAGELRVTPTNALAPVLIKTGNLTIGATSLVELHKNAIQITPGGTTPTTLDGVKTFITTAGFGGIKSSDLTANTALGLALVESAGTFLGSPTAVGDILVRYTLLGDATLDGTVNFDDLLKLAANYNTASKYWYQGDFTNDGNVNFDDLLKLAANYNTSLTGSFGGDWALAQSAVPEPTSLLAVGLGGAALLGRRRRR